MTMLTATYVQQNLHGALPAATAGSEPEPFLSTALGLKDGL